MSDFALEILTPSGQKAKLDVQEVTFPGSEGRFGVLKDHMDLVSSIQPGAVEIYKNGAIESIFIVCDGVVEVRADYCRLLVEKAMNATDISVSEVKENIAELEHRLGKAESDVVKESLSNELQYYKSALEVVEKSGKK